MTARHLLALAVAVVFFAACGGGDEPSREGTATPAPSASPTAGPGIDLPMPQHVSFAPGEMVSAGGAGIYFTDPYTRTTEGWVVPGTEISDEFSVADITSDGRLLIYECRRPGKEGRLAPCGTTDPDAPHTWYLFNTETEERRRLEEFSGFSLTLSPDGKTLFGLTDEGPAFQVVEGGETQLVKLPDYPSVTPLFSHWSPRGDALVLGMGTMRGMFLTNMLLLRSDSRESIELLEGDAGVDWSPDGSRVALVLSQFQYDGETPGILVFDNTGRELWSSPLGGYPNPRWSPDGSRLAAQVDFQVEGCGSGAPVCTLSHLDVFDGATGEPLYRVAGAIACADQVWTADGSRLLVEGYASGGSVLVDPVAGTLRPLGRYVVPTPFDASLAVGRYADATLVAGRYTDGFDAVDLNTGESRPLVETTVTPAWDWLNEPLFVGRRIKFTALHGGHGGCAMGSAPEPPPELKILYPPYGE